MKYPAIVCFILIALPIEADTASPMRDFFRAASISFNGGPDRSRYGENAATQAISKDGR